MIIVEINYVMLKKQGCTPFYLFYFQSTAPVAPPDSTSKSPAATPENNTQDSIKQHGRRSFSREESQILLSICDRFLKMETFQAKDVIQQLKSSDDGCELYEQLKQKFADGVNKKIVDKVRSAKRIQAPKGNKFAKNCEKN